MEDLGFFIIFALLALGAAWFVNWLVGLLSGDHPRDTRRVWLDMLLGEGRGIGALLSCLGPRWVRWTMVAAIAIAFLVWLFFGLFGD